MRKFYYSPQRGQFVEHIGKVPGDEEPIGFETATELTEKAKLGDALVVFSANDPALPPFPGNAYDAARERGMVVWHISDTYVTAKAVRDETAAAKPEHGAGGAQGNGMTVAEEPTVAIQRDDE